MNKLKDTKLNIKPIILTFYHEYVFEGPCRTGNPDMLTKEYDLAKAAKRNASEIDAITKEIASVDDFNVLEPTCFSSDETFINLESMIQEITADDAKTDAYLVSCWSRNNEIVLLLAQRTKKPIVFTPAPLPYQDIIVASMHARGLHEGFAYLNWEDVRKCFQVLRARKVLQSMRILCMGRFGSERNASALDNFADYESVNQRLGVNFVFVNAHEYLDQTHPLDSEKNYTLPGRAALNPTEEDMAEINRITDELINGAVKCEMEREDVLRSVIGYYVIEKMLDAYECNAYAAVCPDICATRRLNEERFTFCLTHSLHHQMGIPSACEYDSPAAVSMAILGALGKKPTFMGNCTHHLRFEGSTIGARDKAAELDSMPDNTLVIWHAVTNPNMRGFDEEPREYILRPFTWSGFGVTLRVDFEPDKGQPVTLCRIDPACTKMLVARGTVAGGVGVDLDGCNIGVYVTVKDEDDFYQKQLQVGNHVPLVYGDCYDEVVALGKLLGLEVLEA